MHYDIFPGIIRLQTVLCIRYAASGNSTYYGILPLQTHSNHVCDCITLNYICMTNRVGIYQGAVVFYCDLTRITVSDIKFEWIYITLPAIILEKMTRYQQVRCILTILHIIYYTTVYNICRHILIRFVILLHLITPQLPVELEFIRESSILSRITVCDIKSKWI